MSGAVDLGLLRLCEAIINADESGSRKRGMIDDAIAKLEKLRTEILREREQDDRE